MGIGVNQAKYATTATKKEFWGVWKEQFRTKEDLKKMFVYQAGEHPHNAQNPKTLTIN